MPAPTYATVATYPGVGDGSASQPVVEEVLAVELANQAAVCVVPAAADPWPVDLVEAVKRRVARTLQLRRLPLGLQTSITDGAVSTSVVGGHDREINRLEAPYRRVVVG